MFELSQYLVDQGLAPFGPNGTYALLVFSVAAFLMLGYPFMPLAGAMTFVERKIAGWTQSRLGPNRVGPFGLGVLIADGIKLILKEDIIPAAADRPLFKLAPYAVLGGAFMTMAVIPLGPNLIPVDLDLGLLVYIAAGSFVTMGIVLSGWSSNNKWSTLGGARSVAQIISYEIPVTMALVPAVILTGTLSFQGMVQAQGPAPWQWTAFHNPGLFLAAWVYFIAALAEINRTPFDIPEAESELVSGYNTEYSGMRFGMFFVAEFANVVVICWILVLVFLGGWHFPGEQTLVNTWFGGTWPTLVGSLKNGTFPQFAAFNAFGHLFFMLKTVPFIVLIVLLRWTLPRVRVDQLMDICWKYLTPMGMGATVLTAVYLIWPGWGIFPAGGTALPRDLGPMRVWGFLVPVGFMVFCVAHALYASRYPWKPARPTKQAPATTTTPAGVTS